MAQTSLLNPASALRITWAQTGSFSDDPPSKQTALEAENELKKIEQRAAKNEKESLYVNNAIAAMKASLRSLDIIYKSRQDNFKENEKLRASYIQSITDSLEFGKKAEDFLKSLPTMTVTAAGGATLGQALGLPTAYIWALALALGGAGYGLNLWFISRARRRTQMQLIQHDYDRNLYYKQYIDRVSAVLMSLYYELDRIHISVFGVPYPTGEKNLPDLIADILSGVQPTFCKFVHEHIRAGKVTPELWPTCETGALAVVKHCPYWIDRESIR
ncbi:MAG: hypothetical protein HXY35_09680 [Chloroflexi bacterium]|nr:hypothetical protein [Chloroflexota bacterium]